MPHGKSIDPFGANCSHSRLGDKPLKFQVFCSQNGTAAPKELIKQGSASLRNVAYFLHFQVNTALLLKHFAGHSTDGLVVERGK